MYQTNMFQMDEQLATMLAHHWTLLARYHDMSSQCEKQDIMYNMMEEKKSIFPGSTREDQQILQQIIIDN